MKKTASKFGLDNLPNPILYDKEERKMQEKFMEYITLEWDEYYKQTHNTDARDFLFWLGRKVYGSTHHNQTQQNRQWKKPDKDGVIEHISDECFKKEE